MKVRVKKVPVRYGGKTYKQDETFDMAEKFFNAAIVDKVKEPEKAPAKEKAPKE